MDVDDFNTSNSPIAKPLSRLPREESGPPILIGNSTPPVERRVRQFCLSVADLYERWLQRHASAGTRRAYRQGVDSFIRFLGIAWPEQSHEFLTARVGDVQRFRDDMVECGYAPKTITHRVCSVSAFYTYLREAAVELRLPINVPNPAHSQFVARGAADPVDETLALTASQARLLKSLPAGDDIIALRDRAILHFYLYTGARLSTGCCLQVSDFRWNPSDSRIRISEKGNRRRTIGIHVVAAEALREYIEQADLTDGSLFRRQHNSRVRRLSDHGLSVRGIYRLLEMYLSQLAGATDSRNADANRKRRIFTPHSLRATTATLLLASGVEISKVQELLGHRNISTTQLYDKRRRLTAESASHDVPI